MVKCNFNFLFESKQQDEAEYIHSEYEKRHHPNQFIGSLDRSIHALIGDDK